MGNAGLKWWEDVYQKRNGGGKAERTGSSGNPGKDWWDSFISSNERPKQKEETPAGVKPLPVVGENKPILESVERDDGIFSMEAPKKKQTAPEATPAAEQTSNLNYQQMADQARKEYEDYIQSEEYKGGDRLTPDELKSKYGTYEAWEQAQIDAKNKAERLKQQADYYQNQENQRRNQEVMQKDLEILASWPEEDRQMLIEYALNDHKGRSVFERSSESATRAATALVELQKKYDKDTIKRLSESYQWYQNEIATKTMQNEAAKEVQGKPGAAIVHSALTLPATVAGTVTAPLDYLGQVFGRTGRYSTLDPNARGNLPNVYSGAVRQQVASDIAGDGSSVGRKAASYLYQGGMSALDTGARLLASGGNPTIAATLAGLGTFGQTVSQASAQGATPAQAIAYGTAAAGIEALTEKLPLDELVKTAKGGWNGLKPAIKEAFKQAGIEVAEEEIGLIASTLAEMAILQEKASTNQRIQQLVAEEGMSVAEANNQVMYELLGEAMDTAVVSAISGGLSSAGGSTVAYAGRDTGGAQTAQEGTEAAKSQETTVAEVTADTATDQQQTQAEEPQSNVRKAVQEFRDTGKVSNRMAEVILNDAESVAALQKETGMELPDTASGRRNAVKDAVAQMSRNEDAKDLTSSTAEALLRNQEQPQEAKAENPEENRRLAIEATKELQGLPKQETVENVDTSQNGLSNQESDVMDHGAVGAAERNYSGAAEYDKLLSDNNVQPGRASDAKHEEVPVMDAYGRRVSEFGANVINSEQISERDVNTVKQLISEGAFGHDVQKMDDIRAAALARINNRKNLSSAVDSITRAVSSGKFSEHDIAEAELLFVAYSNKKGKKAQEQASNLLLDLSQMSTQTGRMLNMFKLLRRLTPEGQLMTVQKNVKRYLEDLNTGRSSRKQVTVEIPRELEMEVLTATTQEQREAAIDAIYKYTASQIKPTICEIWDAWRHLAMLGNPKTHLRNMVGSAAFRPYVSVKRTIGAVIEHFVLDQENRTKAVLGISKNSKALLNWAKEDAKTEAARNAMDYSGTTGDNARNKIEDNRKILPGKLENLRRKNMDLMEREDMIFKKREYALSLASFLKARGYTAEQVQAGKVSDNVMQAGRVLAIQEAMKATFNDRNRFSNLMSKFRAKGNGGWSKVLNIFAKGTVPYTRTPANVLVRAKEYSIVEIGNAIKTLGKDVKAQKGDKAKKATIATGIDQLASGLTGSGAAALGAALAAGLIPGVRLVGRIEDWDEYPEGAKEYSIQIGDEFFSIAWLAPANIPLFIGANFYDSVSRKTEDGNLDGWDLISAIVETASDALDPMLELAVLSGLNDVLDAIAYEGSAGDKVIAAVATAATSYFTQGLPTIFGQAEQATEKTQKTVYSNADNPLQRNFEKAVGRATQKIPIIDLYQTDKIDDYGNVVKNSDNWIVRAANAFFNPFTVTKAEKTPVTEEIKRLSDVQSENVSPPDIPKTITYTDRNGNAHTDQRLTEEQFSKLRIVQGQTAAQILGYVVESDDYKALTDQQKAKVFKYAYAYAREKGREAALDGYRIADSWMLGINGKEAGTIINKTVTGEISGAFERLTTAWKNDFDPAGATETLEEAYTVYDGLSDEAKEALMEDASGRVKDYLEARNAGVDSQTFAELYHVYYDLSNSDLKAAAKAQKWSYELDKAADRGDITQAQKNVLKANMAISTGFTLETEKYDAMIGSGIETDDANRVMGDLSNLKPEGGYSTVRTVQKLETIADADYLTEAEKTAVMKLYMNANQAEKMETTMERLGISAEAYAIIYRAYLEQDKKSEEIAKYMALGYSRNEAEAIYYIQHPK